MENSTATTLYNLLITRNFEPKALSGKTGLPPRNEKNEVDTRLADMFAFDFKTPNKNYGTVVILLGADNNLQVWFGDNLGRGMDPGDKKYWYDFLAQLKEFAIRNRLSFELDDLSKLKYTMQGIAAIKEGLFEGYYGKKDVSYSDQPKQTRLMIKHTRNIGEGEARYRAIDKLFVETEDGARFPLPFKNLSGGRVMARHCSEGGTPYDAFGQHISQTVNEMNTLAKFVRAAKHKQFDNSATDMIDHAVRHYNDLKRKVKHMIGQRGYHEVKDQFDPAKIGDHEVIVDDIRNLFVEQMLDQRIEEALPILARLKEESSMKEIREFNEWANRITEGTWALPDTPESISTLKELMSKPLVVGPDATNAVEQLYDLVGDDILFDRLHDLADQNANANAWDDQDVINRLGELGIDINPTVGPETGDRGVAEGWDNDKVYRSIINQELKLAQTDPITAAMNLLQGQNLNYPLIANTWKTVDQDQDLLAQAKEFFQKLQTNLNQQGVAEGGYIGGHNRDEPDYSGIGSVPERIKIKKGSQVMAIQPSALAQFKADGWEEIKPSVSESEEHSPVAGAITRRIMVQRHDLLSKYGPVLVTQAIDEVAEFVGDVEEIGSSDVSGWIKQVEQMLANNPPEAFGESLKEDLQADDGEYYESADDFFGQFEAESFDNEETSPDGMEVRGYIDGVNVMVWRYDDESMTGGYGYYDNSVLEQDMAEDLDTDGVMMTKPSNMSSESADPVLRLKQMLKH